MERPTFMFRLALSALAVLMLSGCLGFRLAEFTDAARKEYRLTDEELQRVQFYNSHAIILTAVDETRQPPAPKRARKKPLDTRYVDQVVIKRHTRGVVVAAGMKWLEVSFEPGKWLRFTRNPGGRYVLEPRAVIYGDRQYRVECVPRLFRKCPVVLRMRRNLEPSIRVQSQKVKGRRP